MRFRKSLNLCRRHHPVRSTVQEEVGSCRAVLLPGPPDRGLTPVEHTHEWPQACFDHSSQPLFACRCRLYALCCRN